MIKNVLLNRLFDVLDFFVGEHSVSFVSLRKTLTTMQLKGLVLA
jgi:hypothetical protein